MFERLAQAFAKEDDSFPITTTPDPSGLTNTSFTLPHLNLSAISYDSPDIPSPHPVVTELEQACSSSSIDQLLAIKNPHASLNNHIIHSTPPSVPNTSQPTFSSNEHSLTTLANPQYKTWFFDQQLAKKQMMLDTCKALQAYTDLDSNVFQPSTHPPLSQQGTPLPSLENTLPFPNDCPTDSFPKENNRPIEGIIQKESIREFIPSRDCQESNTLSLSLSLDPTPSSNHDPLSESIKLYHRVAHPPLSLDTVRQGNGTAQQLLQPIQPIQPTKRPPIGSTVGESTRDLSFPTNTPPNFDFCSDLPDSTLSPFDIPCLQTLFRNFGGEPAGKAYPGPDTITTYNNLLHLGAVKQYLTLLVKNKGSNDPLVRQRAIMDLYGISSQSLLKRAPFSQGVEVFWFVPVIGQPNQIAGFLKRTVERDIVQFGTVTSSTDFLPQIGVREYFSMLQLTDIRPKENTMVRFGVYVDHGFFLSINQSADIDTRLFESLQEDKPGVFGNLVQGPHYYESQSCTSFSSNVPNVTKLFYEDANGGQHIFHITTELCEKDTKYEKEGKEGKNDKKETSPFHMNHYSLTCERSAPFLTFEVNRNDLVFQELRNPGLFSQLVSPIGLEYHTRNEESFTVPGQKAFVRFQNKHSSLHLQNIAFQSWGTLTIAIRLRSMPVKDTIISLHTSGFFYHILATPLQGSLSKLSIEHNFSTKSSLLTPFVLELNTWYLLVIHNRITEISLSCNKINDIIQQQGMMETTTVSSKIPLFEPNMTWKPAPGQPAGACSILVGTKGFTTWPSMYATGSFTYDIAWLHFFDYQASKEQFVREAHANWIYTSSDST